MFCSARQIDGVLPTTRTAARGRQFVLRGLVWAAPVFFHARALYRVGLSWRRFADLRGARPRYARWQRRCAEGEDPGRGRRAQTHHRWRNPDARAARERLDPVALDCGAGRYRLERLAQLAACGQAIAAPEAASALPRRSSAAQLMPRIDAAIARLRAQGGLNGG